MSDLRHGCRLLYRTSRSMPKKLTSIVVARWNIGATLLADLSCFDDIKKNLSGMLQTKLRWDASSLHACQLKTSGFCILQVGNISSNSRLIWTQ